MMIRRVARFDGRWRSSGRDVVPGTIREGEEQGREQQLAVITASSQLTRCETNYF